VTSGISDTTAQEQARAALIVAVEAALDGDTDLDIGRGFRWPIVNPDWVFATETESDIDPATLGPRRSQDERITLHLSIGAFEPGNDQDAEDAAFGRAFGRLARIQQYIRENDITLGGTVLWCVPGPSNSAGATADSDAGQGRLIEIAASFVCSHRIRT